MSKHLRSAVDASWLHTDTFPSVVTAERIVVETVCNGPHETWQDYAACRKRLTRRVLTEGEFLLIEKVDGQWPTWAINNIVLTHALMHQPDRDFWWPEFLDALTGSDSS